MEVLSTYVLLGIVQQMMPFNPFLLNMFFPNVVTFSSREIAFDKLAKDVTLAPFVSPMVAGKARRKQGGMMKTLEPAYVKPKDTVDPAMLLQRRPGERLGGELSPEQRRLAVITQMLQDQDKQITHREEWMAAQILTTGKVVISGEGYESVEVDFGRAPENTVILSGDAKWSALNKETSRQPLDDLEDWAERCSGPVDTVIMGKKAWRQLIGFESVRELLNTRRGSKSEAETGPSQVRDYQFKGTIGTFEIYVYTGKFKDIDDTQKPFMPEGGVLMGNSGYNGVRAYGAIQDAKAASMGVVESTRYPKSWFQEDPSVEYLMTQSAPLPVTPDANAFLFAQVVDN